jgi:hypothetical protein
MFNPASREAMPAFGKMLSLSPGGHKQLAKIALP